MMQRSTVSIGVHDLQQRLGLRAFAPDKTDRIHVILQCGCEETVGFPVVNELPTQIEHIDQGGTMALDSRVHSGGQPSGPTAFGAARTRKLSIRVPLAGGEFPAPCPCGANGALVIARCTAHSMSPVSSALSSCRRNFKSSAFRHAVGFVGEIRKAADWGPAEPGRAPRRSQRPLPRLRRVLR